MNVQTVMRMAAAGRASSWTAVRLSMMTSPVPFQDPDGAFVSVVETGGAWTMTEDPSTAGVNDGMAEGVAWWASGLGDVIPARAGEILSIDTHLPEFAVSWAAPPADAISWQPWVALGLAINNSTTYAMGVGVGADTTSNIYGVSVANLSRNLTTANSAVRGGFGYLWVKRVSSLAAYVGTAAVTSTNAAWQATVSGVYGQQNATTPGVSTSTRPIVAFGNATVPGAGNRSVTARFWMRVWDLPNWAPWVDSTNWNAISPLDLTLTSDPNAFVSSQDNSNAPEWRVTLDDIGDAVAWDGFDEGARWTSAIPVGMPQGTAPILFAHEITLFGGAYAGARRYGFSAGIYLSGSGSGRAGGWQSMSATQVTAQSVGATSNTAQTGFDVWPTAIDGAVCMIWPVLQSTGTQTGGVNTMPQLDGNVVRVTGNQGLSFVGTGAWTDGPELMVVATKDTTTLGTATDETRFNLWWATIAGYTQDMPTGWAT